MQGRESLKYSFTQRGGPRAHVFVNVVRYLHSLSLMSWSAQNNLRKGLCSDGRRDGSRPTHAGRDRSNSEGTVGVSLLRKIGRASCRERVEIWEDGVSGIE